MGSASVSNGFGKYGHPGWLMIAFITWNSNLVPLLVGLCSSNPCRFEFSVFGLFAGFEATTSRLTVALCPTQLILHRLGLVVLAIPDSLRSDFSEILQFWIRAQRGLEIRSLSWTAWIREIGLPLTNCTSWWQPADTDAELFQLRWLCVAAHLALLATPKHITNINFMSDSWLHPLDVTSYIVCILCMFLKWVTHWTLCICSWIPYICCSIT